MADTHDADGEDRSEGAGTHVGAAPPGEAGGGPVGAGPDGAFRLREEREHLADGRRVIYYSERR